MLLHLPDATCQGAVHSTAAVGSRVKYLVDTSELLWGCLDTQDYLEAAHRCLHHTSLMQNMHNKGLNVAMKTASSRYCIAVSSVFVCHLHRHAPIMFVKAITSLQTMVISNLAEGVRKIDAVRRS